MADVDIERIQTRIAEAVIEHTDRLSRGITEVPLWEVLLLLSELDLLAGRATVDILVKMGKPSPTDERH